MSSAIQNHDRESSLAPDILLTTAAEWISILGLVFGGCCSNVFAMEAVLQTHPGAGIFLTFLQFLYVAIQTLSSQLILRPGTWIPRLRTRTVPLTKWIVQVAMFLTVSLLNNYAFGLKVPVPVHIIFRSGGLCVSMFMGWFVGGKKYSLVQVTSVILISAGILLATLSAPPRPSRKPLTSTSGLTQSTTDPSAFMTDQRQYALGIVVLTLALILSSLLGLWQEKIYGRYGAAWKEGLFYNHALSIPLFLPFLSSFRRDIFTLTTFSPTYTVSLPNTIETFAIDNLPGFPSAGKGLGIAIPSAWIAISANLFTQGMCIRGVNRLTAKVSSVTVNLILTVRKAVSLAISVLAFGSGFNLGLGIGAAMVLVGTVTYSWTNISTQTIKSSDPLKSERPNDEEGKDLQQHSNEVSGAISTGIDGSFTEGDLRKRIIST